MSILLIILSGCCIFALFKLHRECADDAIVGGYLLDRCLELIHENTDLKHFNEQLAQELEKLTIELQRVQQGKQVIPPPIRATI